MPDKCGPRTTTSSKLYFTPVASLKVVQMERLFSFFFFFYAITGKISTGIVQYISRNICPARSWKALIKREKNIYMYVRIYCTSLAASSQVYQG